MVDSKKSSLVCSISSITSVISNKYFIHGGLCIVLIYLIRRLQDKELTGEKAIE